jgi:hypothetical protein
LHLGIAVPEFSGKVLSLPLFGVILFIIFVIKRLNSVFYAPRFFREIRGKIDE